MVAGKVTTMLKDEDFTDALSCLTVHLKEQFHAALTSKVPNSISKLLFTLERHMFTDHGYSGYLRWELAEEKESTKASVIYDMYYDDITHTFPVTLQ